MQFRCNMNKEQQMDVRQQKTVDRSKIIDILKFICIYIGYLSMGLYCVSVYLDSQYKTIGGCYVTAK